MRCWSHSEQRPATDFPAFSGGDHEQSPPSPTFLNQMRETQKMSSIHLDKILIFLSLFSFILTRPSLALEHEDDSAPAESIHSVSEEDCRWQFDQLEVNGAHQIIEIEKRMLPGEGIKIAHIDTGVIPLPNFFNGTDGMFGIYFPRSIVTDGTFNFVEPHLLPIDNNLKGLNFGHGTETASLLVGNARWPTSPERRFMGLVPWAQLIPIKVTDSVVMVGHVSTQGTADAKNLAFGIEKAVSLDAGVLSISLGAVFDRGGSIKKAIENALAQGAIVVAAAGQTLPVNFLPLPANLPGVVSVTASTELQQPWNDAFSNKNISWAAPGVLVCHLGVRTSPDRGGTATISKATLTTRSGAKVELDGIVKRSSGTSYSAALTSAAAALWLQYHDHSALKLRYGSGNISKLFLAIAQKFAMETPLDWDTRRHGAGIINITKLLRAKLPCSSSESQDSCRVKLAQFLKSASR